MAKKDLFLVIGVNQTGSGTLTWPEDFDLIGVYDSEKEANAEAHRLNPEGCPDEEEDPEGYDEWMDSNSDEMVYEVHPVDFRKKGSR